MVQYFPKGNVQLVTTFSSHEVVVYTFNAVLETFQVRSMQPHTYWFYEMDNKSDIYQIINIIWPVALIKTQEVQYLLKAKCVKIPF